MYMWFNQYNKEGAFHKVNMHHLFDINKSQEDLVLVNSSIATPKFDLKLCKLKNPKISHLYETWSKTKVTKVSVSNTRMMSEE